MTSLPTSAAVEARGSRRSCALRRAFPGTSLIVLLGWGAIPIGPGAAHAQDRATSAEFDGSPMYELMVAELAGSRGQLDVAIDRYLSVASWSEDWRVAERATQLAMFANDWSEAERAARRWCELDVEGLKPHESLAQTLLHQEGRIEAAAAEYVALIGRFPAAGASTVAEPQSESRSADAAATRGEALDDVFATLRGVEPVSAGIVMEALAAAYPEQSEAHLGVARLALVVDDRERALAAVDAVLEIDPADHDARLIRARVLVAAGRADDAFDELGAVLAKVPEDVQLRLGYAQLLAETGRDEAARIEFETLYELASDDANVLLTIGVLSFNAGRTEPAKRYFETLLEVEEHTSQARFYLALIADRAQSTREAIAHYEAVEPGQLYADARIRAAELHAVAGDVGIGRAHLRTLADELPDPAMQIRLIVADGRLLQEGEEMKKAVAVFSNGLERFPDAPALLYARALAAMTMGDSGTSEGDLERLIEIEPDNAHALNALGYQLADAGRRLDEAARYLEKAYALEPDDAAILDSLGWLRYRQGDLGAAATLLRRAYALLSDVEIAAHLGEVLWMQGEHDAARDIWEEALAVQPDNETLQRVVWRFNN